MKPDERALLALLAENPGKTPRELMGRPGWPPSDKRAWYVLDKWARQGLYDWGVSIAAGWLTPKGVARAEELAQEPPSG